MQILDIPRSAPQTCQPGNRELSETNNGGQILFIINEVEADASWDEQLVLELDY